MKLTAAALLALLATLSLGPARAVAAPKSAAKSRVTFGVAPASATRPDSRPDFDFGVTPGASLNDHVAVLNFSPKRLSLQLYATDAINTTTGGIGLLPATARPTGAGSWVSLPAPDSTVQVPPVAANGQAGRVIVPFTLRVPDNATPGDHVGGIVAVLRTDGHNSTGQNLVLEQRVGSRLFVRVAGTLAPKLTLTDLHSSYQGTSNPIGRGAVAVSYRVTNSGNVELALNQDVKVTGLLGASRQVQVAKVPLLLPGDSLLETAQVSGVWPELIAHVKVNGLPVAAPGDVDPHLPPVSASARLWAVPWTLLALFLVVAVAIRLAFAVRKRRSAGTAASVPQRVTA